MDDIILPLDPQSNLTPETTYIYLLRDPETNEIRYVGKSNHPSTRLQQHSIRDEATHKGYWINSLRKRGLKPLMEIIEDVPFDVWREREAYWISHYFEHGHPLTNLSFGSTGADMVSDETRLKMSEAHKGRTPPPETLAKAAAARRGSKHTPEARAKISAARLGKPGHKSTPETNAKISAANKGRKRDPFSEEWRRKLGDVSRGKTQSPEHVAKRAAARRGKKASPEARARMSLAQKKRFATNVNPPNQPTLWD